ncbi:OsmC family protein [Rhodohalobacter barkolensis]|uniref:Peroxiredoxin n=1 Tax=Rhodohalobacter barkolensis TaxID=2053187 RepID=A0A2N0VIY5_9BACT|nr:OsmC family protein [Rhodohalobacter barkolensis]PKD44150.1 peroxiredoxin [Rhodohalobacter barkolensis]
MSNYIATIRWNRNGAAFSDQKYQRLHTWSFENGMTMNAAASPNIVPETCTDSSVIDPEEAFTASVASCHMLWFLSIAAGRGYIVNQYSDPAEGVLEKNSEGKMAMTKVIIRPTVAFDSENAPDENDFIKMHQVAHSKCFIANSIKSEIEIIPKLVLE